MASNDAFALNQSDLNGFLFANVGVEASGMPLSVVSALARLGMDPWQEAARLAQLPRRVAAEGLARMIVAMPASVWSLQDATVIAARLVALLPARGAGTPIAPFSRATSAPGRPLLQWAVLSALIGALLAGLAFTALRQREPAPAGTPAGPAASEPAASGPVVLPTVE